MTVRWLQASGCQAMSARISNANYKFEFDSGSSWLALLLCKAFISSLLFCCFLPWFAIPDPFQLSSPPFVISFLCAYVRGGLKSKVSSPAAAAGSHCVPKTLKCKKKNFATDKCSLLWSCWVQNESLFHRELLAQVCITLVPATFDFSVIAVPLQTLHFLTQSGGDLAERQRVFGSSPYYKKHLEPRTLHFSASSPTDWKFPFRAPSRGPWARYWTPKCI